MMGTIRMRTCTKSAAALAIVVTGLGMAASADAQPMPNLFDQGNRWLITAFDDTSTTHQQLATQGICFMPYSKVGTHVQGVWYSDTFPNWRGRYSEEGDRVLMHGDYAEGVGHDGIILELFAGTSPRDEAAGQWTEWREDGRNGRTIVFANARLRRVGKCRSIAGTAVSVAAEDLERMSIDLSSQVAPRYLLNGKLAESPGQADQAPLDDEAICK